MKKSILILLFIITCITMSVVLKVSLAYGFIPPIILLILLSQNKKQSFTHGVHSLLQCKNLYIIILLLGANIAIWMSSGILPTIIYHGFNYVNHLNFLLVTFLTVAVVASVMGTGLGTFSTIGIAFIAIAKPLGYPMPVIVGCIVSGAFIADKISPVSALTNLTLDILNLDYTSYAKKSLQTLLPTIVIVSIMYFFLDFKYQSEVIVPLEQLQQAILAHYNLSLWLLIIPLFMMVLSGFGVHTVYNMFITFFSGSIVSLYYQKITFSELSGHIFSGYHITSESDFIQTVFKGGGMLPMVEVIIIVSLAVFLSGLLMSEKHLDVLIHQLLKNTTKPSDLIFKTGILSMFLTSLTCDQTVGIVVPGEVLQTSYEKIGLSKTVLARTISDTGTIIAPLEFWNVNTLIILGMTGVSSLQYAPYAFLCWLMPLMTLVVSKWTLDKK